MVARFSRAELEAFTGAEVDDLLGPEVRLLFVGINPGLWTAAVNAHFARRGNRFWPALHAAGILPDIIDASGGMSARDRRIVLATGIGISNLVPTATARADELTSLQLRRGRDRLIALITTLRPPVVAVLGLSAFRLAFDRPTTCSGLQAERIGSTTSFPGSRLWVLPNPSGLNAHETVASLARAYRQAATSAGLAVAPVRA